MVETGFHEDLLLATLRRFEQELIAGGGLLVAHMRKEIEIYPLHGDEVHDLLNRHARLANVLAVTSRSTGWTFLGTPENAGAGERKDDLSRRRVLRQASKPRELVGFLARRPRLFRSRRS